MGHAQGWGLHGQGSLQSPGCLLASATLETASWKHPLGCRSNLPLQLTVRVFLPCSYLHRGNRCSGAPSHPPSPSPQAPCCLSVTGVHLPHPQPPWPLLPFLQTKLQSCLWLCARQHWALVPSSPPVLPSPCLRFVSLAVQSTAQQLLVFLLVPKREDGLGGGPDI